MVDEVVRLRSELEASEARFRSVIVRNADAIVLTDRDGVVLFANPAAEALFGCPAAALVGAPFGFPIVAGDTTELDIVGRSGTPAVAEMRVVETEWEGQPAYLASLRDITERKQAEGQRARLAQERAARQEAEEAIRRRDEFLAIVAHELRTPLTSIRGYAQLLLRQLDHDDSSAPAHLGHQLKLIDRESRRLARLITQLLDVTNIRAGQLVLYPEPTNIVPIVERVVAAARAETDKHELRMRAPAAVWASVDARRLEQVLSNLVENSIRYSPEGGRIEIEVGAGDRKRGDGPIPDPRPSTPEPLVITVRDRGLGIPPEYRQGLFDRFHQAHRAGHLSGLGLGLYVARQLARLHGGELEAEFPPEGGTRFILTLPVEGPTPRSPA